MARKNGTDLRAGGRNSMAGKLGLARSFQERLHLKLRQSGVRIFGNKSTELPTIPDAQLISHATRYLEGGRARFIEAVEHAVHAESINAKRWWLVYADLLPSERLDVSFDDVAVAAGVKPWELVAEVISAEMKYGLDVARLARAVLVPTIAHQAGKSAKRIGGPHAKIAQEDRMALLQASGFLPTPKGTVVTVNASASASAQAAAAAAADPSMPSFMSDMEALGATRESVQRQLATAAPALDPIDADVIADLVKR